MDGMFWGIVGLFSGGSYGALMGGMGGAIVGGAVGILKFAWTALNVTIITGGRLSAVEALEVASGVAAFTYGGAQIGAISLGSVFGISYGIYLAYEMSGR